MKAAIFVSCCIAGLGLLPGTPALGAGLSLAEAERLALDQDPGLTEYRHLAQAKREQAIAEGQWMDPMLSLGVESLPVDTFTLTAEPMSQLKFGLTQALPRGDSLRYKQEQMEVAASGQEARGEERQRLLRRSVREAWLDVSLQIRTADLLAKNRQELQQLIEVTAAQYALGGTDQQMVLQAQLELAALDDRLIQVSAREDKARAELARWIGGAARRPLAESLPRLPIPAALEQLREALLGHSVLNLVNADVAEKRLGVQLAREEYKPAWSASVSYGDRFGKEPDGASRAAMLTAMLEVELPIFTGKRQDRRLAAREQELAAMNANRDDQLRELQGGLESAYATWSRLGERRRLYQGRLLPQAEANAVAALSAYRSGVTDFESLLKARVALFDARIEGLTLEVEQLMAQARLLYFAGEQQ